MKRRKKFHVSLRVFLVGSVLLGSVTGLYVDRARRQYSATQWILNNNNGYVSYDFEIIPSKLNEPEWVGNGYAPNPWEKVDELSFGQKLVRDLLGIDYASTVVAAEVSDTYSPVNDLSKLQSLPNLQHLVIFLGESADCDISPISRLTKLRRLEFYGISLNELPELACVETLQVLILNGTGISNVRNISMLPTLERIEIDSRIENTSPFGELTELKWLSVKSVDFDIADFSMLKKLEHLELDVLNCQYSDAELKELETILPTTEITIESNGTWLFESEYYDQSKYESSK